MKNSVFALVLAVVLLFFACNKNDSINNSNCNMAVINKTDMPCVTWGITKDGITYPTESDLPAEFQQEGLKVCVQYELITDPASCTCCGTKARIISISKYN